ncbi:MAG: hypothetical protein IKA79_01620, partial [Lentisphaeria bacterium]|nr:hypothetical protein [Lentisphaeria bacterium]
MKNFKKFLTILPGVLASIFLLCACSGKEEGKKSIKTKFEKKALIVYYSQSDKQNTATVAKWIGEQTKGKLFPVTMKKPYTGNYFSVLKEAKKHLKENTKPKILPCEEDIASYDVIFIGSPVWFGTFAPP